MDHPPHGSGLPPVSLLDPAWTRRSVASLLAAGAGLGLLWLVLDDGSLAAGVAVVVTCAACLGLAAWMALDRTRPPRVPLTFVLLVLGVLITGEVALAGPASSPFALFYVWLLPWSFLLWEPRRAIAYVGVIALAYGALLVADDPGDLHVVGPAWLVGMGGVGAIGWVLRAVTARLGERHAAAARTAHNQTLLTAFARRALAERDVDRSLGSDGAAVVHRALGADRVQVLRRRGDALVATGTAGRDVAAARGDQVVEVQIGDAPQPIGVIRVVRLSAALDPHEVVFVRGVADVLALATARAATARERLDQAGVDTLTGLPGRERFAERLSELLPRGGTLMLLDLDDFSLVNETLGPRAGDVLLRGVAQRLRRTIGDDLLLARVGGDELAVFATDARTEVAGVELAGRLQRTLAGPFDLADAEHHVSVSIGILPCAPGAYADERAAIRDAHVAQRRAKELGRGRHETFDAELRASLERRRALEEELRLALRRREFRLAFQPIVELEHGGVIGAETLVRWHHPTRGLVGPCEFIEVAEASDLIVPLGAWILREAFRQLKAWESAMPAGFRLGINLSGRQLAAPGFAASVRRLLQMHELDPARIVFELTETALADESAQVERAVAELREIGVAIALDDFGTGYASLSYLRRFAFASLKLDRSFTARLGDSEADAALITAAIAMGRAMGMNVVGEGVETPEQAETLRAMGCTLAQGFHFARPMDAASLRAFVTRDARLVGAR